MSGMCVVVHSSPCAVMSVSMLLSCRNIAMARTFGTTSMNRELAAAGVGLGGAAARVRGGPAFKKPNRATEAGEQ